MTPQGAQKTVIIAVTVFSLEKLLLMTAVIIPKESCGER